MYKIPRNNFFFLVKLLQSKEVNNRRECHVKGDNIKNVKSHRSKRLSNFTHINEWMSDSRDDGNPKEPRCKSQVRLGENKAKTQQDKNQNVFQIVEMASSSSIDLVVLLHLETLVEEDIFGVHWCLHIWKYFKIILTHTSKGPHFILKSVENSYSAHR